MAEARPGPGSGFDYWTRGHDNSVTPVRYAAQPDKASVSGHERIRSPTATDIQEPTFGLSASLPRLTSPRSEGRSTCSMYFADCEPDRERSRYDRSLSVADPTHNGVNDRNSRSTPRREIRRSLVRERWVQRPQLLPIPTLRTLSLARPEARSRRRPRRVRVWPCFPGSTR